MKEGAILKDRKELLLEGLTCPVCADKIEKRIKEIDFVENAVINLSGQILTLEIEDNGSYSKIKEEIEKIVKNYEPHVTVKEKGKKGEDLEEIRYYKSEIFLLLISILLFALTFIINLSGNIKIVIYLMIYIFAGKDVIKRFFKNILRGQIFDENSLMTIATLGAFAIREFPEGVAVMLFYQIGEKIQERAVNSSRKSIKELMNIRPNYANLKINGNFIKVSPEKVKAGDIIAVGAGEKIPLDGIVVEGSSFIDTFSLTGEAIPKRVNPGDEVLSGCINKNGLLIIKVTRNYEESAVSKILDLVEQASFKKAQTENFITTFARYYTPAVVLLAVLIAIFPPLIFKDTSFSFWFYRALIFLVISCPCALVISIPLGFFAGLGRAAREGILIKGGNYLEALNFPEIVVFDKTGTLTKGVYEVTEVKTKNGFSPQKLLEFAALAEGFSNHPVALSLKKAYGKEIEGQKIERFEEIPGYGVKALVNGLELLVGNEKLLKKNNIDFYETENEEGITKVHVAVNGVYAGSILISDEIREDSALTIKSLKEMGIKNIVMLTGDKPSAAAHISRILGIEEYYPELLPHQKVEKVEELMTQKTKKGKLIFMGDGTNDAPVLMRSDIGISMGRLGSDAAIEASDVVLMEDKPYNLVKAIKIARITRKIVIENIALSLGFKLIILILGAFGHANMWEAVFADVGVALFAVLNSLRLLKIRI